MNVQTLHKRMERMSGDQYQQDTEGDRTVVSEIVSGLIAETGLHAEPLNELLMRISSEECLFAPAVYATSMLASAVTNGTMLRTAQLAQFFSVIGLYAYRLSSSGEIEQMVQLILDKHSTTFEEWIDDCSADDTETLGSLFTIVTLSSSLQRKHHSRLMQTIFETDVLAHGHDLESAEWLLCVLRSQFGQRSYSPEAVTKTSFKVMDQQRVATQWVSTLIAALSDWKNVSSKVIGEIVSEIGCTPAWSSEIFDLEKRTCVQLLCKLLTCTELDCRLAFKLATMVICKERGYDSSLVSIQQTSETVRIEWTSGRRPRRKVKNMLSVEVMSALQGCEPLRTYPSNFFKIFEVDLRN